MLDTGLKFLESLPEEMVKPIGNVVYANLAIRLKPKEHPFKNVFRIAIIIGVVVAIIKLYKRYINK